MAVALSLVYAMMNRSVHVELLARMGADRLPWMTSHPLFLACAADI